MIGHLSGKARRDMSRLGAMRLGKVGLGMVGPPKLGRSEVRSVVSGYGMFERGKF